MFTERAVNDDVITFQDVTFKYPKAANFALHEINLAVQRGEFLAVVGPTGAGKTTMCLTLNGIVPHFYGGDFYGEIRVNALDTVEHPTHRLAEHVAMVFEDAEMQLTAPTAFAEVAFALENIRLPVDEIRRRVASSLEAVRLHGLEDKHPHQLSGGQKQRLAIAAALALQPAVLVLDEPTSQLDPVGTDEVFTLLRELNRTLGITIVLVSHASEELAEFADRTVLLSQGRLLSDAPPAEFFQDVERLRSVGVRTPQVTETWHEIFHGRQPDSRFPVTLEEAVEHHAALRPRLSIRALHYEETNTKHGPPLLSTRDLRFRYPDGTDALNGVSLEIRQGEYVAMAGQNGAGKSTLVRHFVGLLQPSHGTVEILGRSVEQYEVSDLAGHIGYVSQNPDNQIFCDTVRREVAFALENLRAPAAEIEAAVDKALTELKLQPVADRHPLTLSKGDRSRIVIAAILTMQPDAVIFDEPTTGQDYEGARAILDLTRQLHESGRTIIVITHHLYLLPGFAERLIVMGSGTVLGDGDLRSSLYETKVLRESFLVPPQLVQFAQAIRDTYDESLQPITARELAASISFN
jgi:energy-coupling factor transporter ATP-binding protein EcfA2